MASLAASRSGCALGGAFRTEPYNPSKVNPKPVKEIKLGPAEEEAIQRRNKAFENRSYVPTLIQTQRSGPCIRPLASFWDMEKKSSSAIQFTWFFRQRKKHSMRANWTNS